MNEKDTVSSQDIPALVRALGTLALAAATAVAIRWFISHDPKEKNTECNEVDLQNNLSSKVQDELTTCDGCLDGLPPKSPLEVSNERGMKLNVLLEVCRDSGHDRIPAESSCSSQSIISEEDIDQQIDTKEEKTECNETDLQKTLLSKVQDEQTTCDGCLDGGPPKSPLEVSNEGGMKLNVLLEGCHDSGYDRIPAESSCSSQSIISEEDIGQHIDTKEEKTECNEADQQNNLFSKVHDEQATNNGCLNGVPPKSPSKVINEDGINLTALLESCLDSAYYSSQAESSCSSQSIFSEGDIGQQIDTKEKKIQCIEQDLQDNLSSKVHNEQTTYDGCFHGVPPMSPSEVSNDGGLKLKVLLQSCQVSGYHKGPTESSCISQRIISEEENGQHIELSCGIAPKKANTIGLDACRLHMVVTSPTSSTLLTQREDGYNAFTSTTGSSTNNATEDHMFSGCLTHRCESLPIKRSANIQEPERSFGPSLGCDEYVDDFNAKCAESEYKLSSQDNSVAESFVQHSTVSIGINVGTLDDGPNEIDRVLNCHSETKEKKIQYIGQDLQDNLSSKVHNEQTMYDGCLLKHTTYPEKQKCHTNKLVNDFNDKDNTLVSRLGNNDREKVEVICNPFAFAENLSTRINARISKSNSVPEISDSTAQFSVENNTLHCTAVLSGFQKALTHETVESTGDMCKETKQYVTLNSRTNSQRTNIYPSEGTITVNDDKGTEIPNENLKHSIPDTGQNMHDNDNDTKNMVLPLENVLPVKKNKTFQKYVKPIDGYTDRHQGQSHCDPTEPRVENMADNTNCYLNSTKELPSSDNQRDTNIYDYVEHNVWDLEDPDASFMIQKKQSDHQFFAEEMTVVENTGTLTDLIENPIPEKVHEVFDVNNKNVGLYTTVNDFPSLDTVNSVEDTKIKFIGDVKSINCDKENTEFQNCDHLEGHNAITNGYLATSPEVPDYSKMIKKQGKHCSKEVASVPSEPSASLQDTSFPTKNSTLENAIFFKDSNFLLPAMMGAVDNAKKQNQGAVEENNVFQECINIDKDGQLPSAGDPINPYSKLYAKDNRNDPTCCNSNLVPTQDQNLPLRFNNATKVCYEDTDITQSREKIMSTIAENPDLILPEYQSKLRKKKPLIAKSCDNILSGHSYQGATLKSKAQSMLCLLTEYYSSQFTSDNGPVEEVARGSFICIPKSLQNTGEALRFQLTLGNCLELLKLARKNRVQELLKAVYTVISDNYLNVLQNSSVYGQLTGLEREKILQLRMRGHLSLCVVETKSIFGLNKNIRCPMETTEGKAQLYSLDLKSNKWSPLTSIPEEACLKGCSICSMHNYLFIAGGLQENSQGLTCSNKLFCYNPLTDIWTQLSPMNEGRSQLKLIPLDGYLYAIGGECLHTVEKYDPRLNKWTFVAPLPKGTLAVAHEAAACRGQIYISGGHLFYRLLKYNPVQDEWEECPFNGSKGRSCDMVAVGSILYRFDMQKDSSVNILKYNTMAKMWSEYTATFPGSKSPFRCALLEGNIYCINRETTAKFSMECERAVFEEGVFCKVPTWGVGSPHPIVLYLHGSMSQTSV